MRYIDNCLLFVFLWIFNPLLMQGIDITGVIDRVDYCVLETLVFYSEVRLGR